MTMSKKRASRAVKFSVSMPASDFEEIEAARGKSGKSRSRFLRDAVLGERAGRTGDSGSGSVREERNAYGLPDVERVTDAAELRRRAISAAGALSSGVQDLSTGHDRYLSEDRSRQGHGAPEHKEETERKP